jgi:uncharacterized membrane protein YeaQ/YmgE (transglycosylase-associated protein family)
MGVISWIVIGQLAGGLAGRIVGSPAGLVRTLVVGLVGTVLGGFLARKLGIAVAPDFWGELITAIAGTTFFPGLRRALRRA